MIAFEARIILSVIAVLLASACSVEASGLSDPAAPAQQNGTPTADDLFDAYLEQDRTDIRAFRTRGQTGLLDELSHRTARDQSIRRLMLDMLRTPGASPDEAQWTWLRLIQRMQGIDRDNRQWLKAELETLDWFTISEFGADADNNAFLIVQHATDDPDFMRDIHARFERLLPQGEIAPDNYALLTDRLAVIDGLPQPYGSQFECVDGQQQLQTPLSDAEEIVDVRRAEVGLPTMSDYRALLPPCGTLPVLE